MTPESKNNNQTAAAPTAVAPVQTSAALLAASMKLEELQPQFSIVPSYAEIGKKPERFIFVGISETKYQKTDKETGEVKHEVGQCIQLLKAGKMYVHRGIQLIRTFEEYKIAVGQPVEISLKEEVKNSTGGKTKIFDVVILG